MSEVISGFLLGLIVAVVYLLIRMYQVEQKKLPCPIEPRKPLPTWSEWETLFEGPGPIRLGDFPPEAQCESLTVDEVDDYGYPITVDSEVHVFLRKDHVNEKYEEEMALYQEQMATYAKDLALYQESEDSYKVEMDALRSRKKSLEEELAALNKRINNG